MARHLNIIGVVKRRCREVPHELTVVDRHNSNNNDDVSTTPALNCSKILQIFVVSGVDLLLAMRCSKYFIVTTPKRRMCGSSHWRTCGTSSQTRAFRSDECVVCQVEFKVNASIYNEQLDRSFQIRFSPPGSNCHLYEGFEHLFRNLILLVDLVIPDNKSQNGIANNQAIRIIITECIFIRFVPSSLVARIKIDKRQSSTSSKVLYC